MRRVSAENGDQRAVDEACSILNGVAAKHDRQADMTDELEVIGSMLLTYAMQTLDAAIAGTLDLDAACAFEATTNAVQSVVETTRSIHGL